MTTALVPSKTHEAAQHTGGFDVAKEPDYRFATGTQPHGQRTMPPTITDQETPTSEDEVARFEAALGAPLPASYRAFLLVNNGGRSDLEQFAVRWRVPPHRRPETTEVLENFLSLGVGVLELRDTRRALSDRFPPGMLSIAEDPFGNQILLGLTGEHRGRVYFWIHDLRPEIDEADPATLGEVADSFDAFLAGLRPLEGD